MNPSPLHDDAGAGSTMMAGTMALLLILAIVASTLVASALAGARARNAADMAALAAATNATGLYAEVDPCAIAEEIAHHHGARLATCHIQGSDVTVSVTVPVHTPLLHSTAQATARAGPRD